MSRARDQRRQARLALHRDRSVPALYIAVQGATPVPCTVRVHRKREDPMVGGIQSMPGAATVAVPEDRIVFYLPQLPAIRRVNAVVSVEAGEAYRIEFLYPSDDLWQIARVVPMTATEAAGLPVPA